MIYALASSIMAARATPTPAPAVTPRVVVRVHGSNVFIDQSASGPGITPPEGAGFAAGSLLSPMSPYDWFSGAPTVPGIAGIFQYELHATERFRAVTATLRGGLLGIDGDATNAAYWGEPLFGAASPHWGHGFDPGISFPTQPGYNDVFGGGFALLSGSLGANDGRWKVRGGYFDLAQTDRFVFAPPPVTSVLPASGTSLPETLGPGAPALDTWEASPATLPLFGADATARIGHATLELTDARLPALAGTSVRLVNGSVVFHAKHARVSAQVSAIENVGAPIATTTFFGTSQQLSAGPQGWLFSSTLGDQYQTTAGVSALLHLRARNDFLVQFGRAWYHDRLAAHPGTQRPGDYEHVAMTHHFSRKTKAAIEYYRFDPRYAPIVLPYGVAENVWSIAWSWPGEWLKSDYQSVDNTIIGINREGYRVRASTARGKLQLRAAASVWRQIEPASAANAAQEGWVDGFFLVQPNAAATIGWQRQVALYSAWRLKRDTIALDAVWDRSYRPVRGDPYDLVDMTYPQVVLSVEHRWNRNALAVAGYGRYSANGMWATTPVLGIYGVAFVGGEWSFGRHQLLVQLRHQGLVGLPSMPGGPPPTMQGTTLLVDERVSLGPAAR